MHRLLLTSPKQIEILFKNNPALYKIPSLSGLSSSLDQQKKPVLSKPCAGCPSQSVVDYVYYSDMKPQIEQALTNLTNADYRKIKELLNVGELCYYKKIEGKMEVICI